MTARIAPCLRDLLRLILPPVAGLATLLLAPAPAVGESEARIAAREQARAAELAQERREEARQPYAMLRTLQSLQERIAHGDIRAHEGQRALITRVAETFLRADPAEFADKRNANAAVSFVLGGGPPIVLERMLALDPAPAIDPTFWPVRSPMCMAARRMPASGSRASIRRRCRAISGRRSPLPARR